MAPWLQSVANYPVADAGMLLSPRGFASMLGMMLVGRLSGKVDQRVMVAVGLLSTAWSFWEMTTWNPNVSYNWVLVVMSIQGFGLGVTFIPLQVIAFATLSPHLRTQGSAFINLMRNIGAALGVSMMAAALVRGNQSFHEQLGTHITPFNRALDAYPSLGRLMDPDTRIGAAYLDRMVSNEATVIAYLNDFWLLALVSLGTLALLPLLRKSGTPAGR
jgi:DHA2 family multidrug resistance protein